MSADALIYPPVYAAGEWIPLGPVDALFADGECHGTVINGLKLGLFLIEGEVFAVDDICTHGNARLSEGDLDGFEIECPLHAGAFDVRTGKALCSPLVKDARCHAVRIEDGALFVQLSS